MNEKQFIKGFNNGYFLAEERPELLNTLLTGITTENSSYLEGLQEGRKQRENERERGRIQQSIQQGNSQEKGKGKDR